MCMLTHNQSFIYLQHSEKEIKQGRQYLLVAKLIQERALWTIGRTTNLGIRINHRNQLSNVNNSPQHHVFIVEYSQTDGQI